MEFLNDDLEIIEIIENGFPRNVNNRRNYFEELPPLTFFQRFRLTKETTVMVLEQIQNFLEFDDEQKNNCISPMNQLLTTLRVYATGSHLSLVADYMGIHTATASRIVKRVSEALARLSPTFITMPQGEEIIEIQNDFFQIASFPRVIGCVDGTHIRIQSPGGEDGEIFRNRKGYYSVNVQLTADASLKIKNVVARWPGSQHDNTIFTHSRIRMMFEADQYHNCVLLGDSGYALRNYLLTPILQPAGRGEILYNEAQIRTRNTIERTNGVIKRRFPILAYGNRLKLETALSVIVACSVLHNIAREQHEPEPPIDEYMNVNELEYLIEMGNIPDQPPAHGNAPNFYRN